MLHIKPGTLPVPRRAFRLSRVPRRHVVFCPWRLGAISLACLLVGHYRHLQRILVGLVVTMSCVFLATAARLSIDWSALLTGLFRPTIPTGALTEVLAIVGTTLVPYNLFLHASVSANKRNANSANPIDTKQDVSLTEALAYSRMDTLVSVALGGFVTAAIMVTATTAFFTNGAAVTDLSDAAQQLEPLVGKYSRWLFGIGLFAAGLTSAITAPLAAAYAAAGCFRWPSDLTDWRLRLIVTVVILFGTYFAATGASPTKVITLAQVANGLLLPLLAIFLLAVMNNGKLLGQFRNRWLANGIGILAVIVVGSLGLRNLYNVLGSMIAAG